MKKVLLLFILLISFIGVSQKLGHLPYSNFTAKDYKGDTQVNGVAKNSFGIVYIAHNSGVSYFDGKNWNVVEAEKENMAQSICIDKNDNVFVGKKGDFGVVEIGSNGVQRYKSLKSLIGKKISFNEVWKINTFKDGVIFYSNENLFFYKSGVIKIISHTGQYNSMYKVDEKLFLKADTNKIYTLNEKSLKLESYQIKFPQNEKKRVVNIFSLYKNTAVVVTKKELFKLNIKSGIAKKVELVKNFTFNQSGIRLDSDFFILSTSTKGSFVFDNNFQIIEQLSTKYGMLSDTHIGYCLTKDGNLIITSTNGISVVYLNSQLRLIDAQFGLKGSVNDVIGLDSCIYTVGDQGIYLLHGIENEVVGLNNLKQKGYRSDKIQNDIYFSMDYGLYKLNKEKNIIDQINDEYPWIISRYKSNPRYVVQGDANGVIIYKYDSINKSLIEYDRKQGDLEAESCFEDEHGVLWFGGYKSEGIYKYEPKFNLNRDYNSGEFSYFSQNEIGIKGDIRVFGINGQVYFATSQGVYTYRDEKFIPAEKYNSVQNGNFGANLGFVDDNKRIWVGFQNTDNKKFRAGFIAKDGQFNFEAFEWLNEDPIYSFYSNGNHEVWIGTPVGLYYGDLSKEVSSYNYGTYIRRFNYGDSLVHEGFYYKANQVDVYQDTSYTFPHSNKSLEFYFGTNVFIPFERIEYSYKLEGFNEGYSEWSFEDKATFTNLPKGKYRLIVKSRNKSGIEGQPVEISFKILAPWYQTWWFITLCVIVGMVILWGLYRLRTRALRQRQEELENTVEERTAEVVEQKKEVEIQRDEAEHQKKTVEHKNREIMESITYAKRLQEAILPPPRLVKEWLTESFLYFKPKDIVAGDFYWMDTIEATIDGRKKTLIFFAAADCTGHGVPGAMVSVVCANAMNRAVKEFKLSDPGKVLDKVTELVIQSFDRSDEDIKDGMDIALCALDVSDKKLYYSGANNPLYIIRETVENSKNKYKSLDEKVELIEIKATKQPVGKYDLVKAFETQVIDLIPGDAIYVFSDGFADQFGGPKGKKYKYATFKRYLLEISQLEMEDQKAKLHTEFETWRDGLEQVDDICIIGVRVNGQERKNFTDRELEVLAHLNSGLSSKLIADKMGITKNTVDTYRRRLLAKTSTYNATELINYCKEKAIL